MKLCEFNESASSTWSIVFRPMVELELCQVRPLNVADRKVFREAISCDLMIQKFR